MRSRHPNRTTQAILVVAAAALVAGLFGSSGEAAQSPRLAGFERLIGGKWQSGDSFHVIEWGFGNKTVTSRSFSVAADGSETLSAEGTWFWHPADQEIVGYAVAVGMPFELMEMRTRFEGDTLISQLRAINADGSAAEYVESWEFTDADTYAWTLHGGPDLEAPVLMSSTFTRRR